MASPPHGRRSRNGGRGRRRRWTWRESWRRGPGSRWLLPDIPTTTGRGRTGTASSTADRRWLPDAGPLNPSRTRFGWGSSADSRSRGCGHSLPGFSTCDGGIVIDLSPMRAVQVDPDARDRPRGGCRWSDYDTATTRHGLASTGGVVSTTGVAGLTIGGGIGWLMNEHGLACDNLVGAQVVTAGGQIIETSDPGHADLLWGTAGRRWKLRGRHPLRFPRVADWARNRRSRLLP